MSHPFPLHECGGEGVGLARGRGGVKTPPEQTLCCMLLVLNLELLKLELEDAKLPPSCMGFGSPLEEGAGTPKNLRWDLRRVLGAHLALKLFLLHLFGILGLNFKDTSLTFRSRLLRWTWR